MGNMGVVTAMLTLLLFGCSPFHSETPLTGDNADGNFVSQGDPVARETALAYLQSNCSGCHGTNGSGGVSNILDVEHLIQTGLIVPGDSTQGRLIGSMEDGSMPTSQRASAADIQIIRDWLDSDWTGNGGGTGTGGGTGGGGGGSTPPPTLQATYDSIRTHILVPKCLDCHGANRADENIRYDTYNYTLGAGGFKNTINTVNPGSSSFYRECNSGSMPPRNDGYQPLTPTELQVIYDWMLAGAPEN